MAEAGKPRTLGSYLWDSFEQTRADMQKFDERAGGVLWNEAARAGHDIGNTFQSVLYGGWSSQAAHNTGMRIAEAQAIEDDNKRVAPEQEVTQDGPEKV
jgi:hypothetical protein